jgi:HK97 family phage portal protein
MLNWLKKTFRRSDDTIRDDWLGLSAGGLDWTTYAPSHAGVSITRNSCFSLPAFYRGVQLVSSRIGKTPCPIYKVGPNNSRTLYTNHPAYTLLNRFANWQQPSYLWKRQIISDAIWAGNGYGLIQKQEGIPTALVNLDPETTSVFCIFEPNGTPDVWYTTTLGNVFMVLRAERVIHVRNIGHQWGLVGLKPIDILKDTFGLGIGAIRYGATYFKNNGGVLTVIQTPNSLKDEAAVRQFKAGWEENHTRPENSHKFVILQAGATLNRVGISNEEAQFIESRRLTTDDMACIVGISGHKVGSKTNSSYGSTDAENTAMLDDTYDPWFCGFEGELMLKLLTEAEKRSGKVIIEFDRSSVQKGDAPNWEQRQVFLRNNGAISWPEMREALGKSTELPEGVAEWVSSVQTSEPDDQQEESLDNVPVEEDQKAPPFNEDEKEPDDFARSLLLANVERLVSRLQKDKSYYSGRHRDIFRTALPGCDTFIENFFDELDAVLPEQRQPIIDGLNPQEITGKLWNDLHRE